MARTKNGKLTGRAAATELADERALRLEAALGFNRDILQTARVNIRVADSMVKRDNWQWPSIITSGLELYADTLANLIDLVNADPEHRRVGG